MLKKLLITDLDDTLYSWINFFIPAFYDMVEELSIILNVPQAKLVDEYKKLHQEFGNVEHPYTTLQLPSVQEKFPGMSSDEIKKSLKIIFDKFNQKRFSNLKLYEGVYETLEFLKTNDIKIVGYTDSAEENGFYRIKILNIVDFFSSVYVSESLFSQTNSHERALITKRINTKKPDAEILKRICNKEGISLKEAIYVGDSKTKDVYMALKAGITAVWINYKENNFELYQKLVKISHWNEEDFNKEIELKQEWDQMGLKPDYEINSYKELIPIIFNS